MITFIEEQMCDAVAGVLPSEGETVMRSAAPNPVAAAGIKDLRAAGIGWLQIFSLLATYGPELWKILQEVIDAIRKNEPLPSVPA